MKSTFSNLLFYLIFLLAFSSSFSQELNVSGASISHREIGMSYVIGNLNAETLEGNELMLIPGVIHRNTIIKKIIPFKENEVKIDYFPNPAMDVLYIEVHSKKIEKVDFKIVDVTGKEFFTGVIDRRIRLDISEIPNQIYYMSFKYNNRLLDSRKFIKIN